jgi:hypothetical protein
MTPDYMGGEKVRKSEGEEVRRGQERRVSPPDGQPGHRDSCSEFK